MARELSWHYGGMDPTGEQRSMAQVARSAAEWLKVHKWTKGQFFDGDAGCALAAISIAAKGGWVAVNEFQEMEKELLAQLHAMYPALKGVTTIPEINDHESVTQEGMVAAFEKTALHFEEMT